MQGRKKLEARKIPLDPTASIRWQRGLAAPFYVVVEKILSGMSACRRTGRPGHYGYDFAREVKSSGGCLWTGGRWTGLQALVGPDQFCGGGLSQEKQVIEELFPSELQNLACRINDWCIGRPY